MKKRLNIGLFVDDLDNDFTSLACKGAELGAINLDANLFVFPGRYLDSAEFYDEHTKYEYQYNMIFQFAHENNLDVLFVIMGTIACRTDFEKQKEFLDNLPDIPIITLFSKIEGYPSVTFDNKAGCSVALSHLIEEHRVSKIGFVSGPKTNVDANERLQVFQEVLKAHDLPYVEDRVVYGSFESDSDAVTRDLIERNPDLEAIIFANDQMAIGGYRVLDEMEIEIGKNMRVMGFDNIPFAVSMNPPLSTVDANAAELTYRAMMNVEDFLATGELKVDNLVVATQFVQRESCGCEKFDYDGMAKRLSFDDLQQPDGLDMQRVHDYLFGVYASGVALVTIKDDLTVFMKLIHEMVLQKNFDKYSKDALVVFSQVIEQSRLRYTNTERFFNVLISFQYELSQLLDNDRDKMQLMALFSKMYRNLALSNSQMVQGQRERIEMMSYLINGMTGDLFLMDVEDEIPYESALQELSDIGMQSTYLYTFQTPLTRGRHDAWIHPKKMLIKAYSKGGVATGVAVEKQLIKVERILHNEYLPKDHRVTMVLSPLFSGEAVYGLLLSEVGYEYFSNILPVTFQLSAALKSLALLEKQREAQKKLQLHLDKIKESNEFLNEISRSDELTGLYNRRGFLEYAHNAISSRKNRGKKALIVYADMDNLKMINDEYGHDEGDFALREIANILRDTFRSTDIIGRFGGDEFVAFAMVGVDDYENIMKRRIAEITIRHNEAVDKPYPIEMSTGIAEFECSADIDLYDILDIADERLYDEKREKKAKNGSYR